MQRDGQGHWVGSLEDLAHTLTETLAKMSDAEKAEFRREIAEIKLLRMPVKTKAVQ